MRSGLAAFCVGILLACFAPFLHESWSLSGLGQGSFSIGLGLCLARIVCRHRQGKILLLPGLLLLGIAYHCQWALCVQDRHIDASTVGKDFVLTGRVTNLPVVDELSTRFLFTVSDGAGEFPGHKLLLRDYQQLGLRGGEVWQLALRLRPPHGLANPAAFDYEAWLLREKIVGLGYVQESASNRRLSAHSYSVSSMRQLLLERLQRVLPVHSSAAAVMPALLLGYRGELSAEFWAQLSATGTNHLFVISGLHVGLVSLLAFRLMQFLGRFLLWPGSGIAVPRLAAWSAISAALLYSLLAGFSLPTQRALVMLAVFMSGTITGKSIDLVFRYLLALTLVLLLNPAAATGPGFWLSFTAVAGLILFADAELDLSRIRGFIRAQWVVSFVLALPLLFWMGQVSLLAPLVNFLAIPVLGFVILPLAFLALLALLIMPSLAELFMSASAALMKWLLLFIEQAAEYSPVFTSRLLAVSPLETTIIIALAMLGLTVVLIPFPLRLRLLALFLFLPLLFPRSPSLRPEHLSVHIMDVGQGLAVFLQQGENNLLYDTGAALGPDYDMGETVVLPVLASLGVRQLQTVVISHGDNDHAGGLASVLQAMPVARLISSGPLPVARSVEPCRQGQYWQQGAMEISVLHPDQAYSNNNNNSCVLQIRFGLHRLLLSGDIDKAVERDLASRYGRQLSSQLLIAPHHGSNSSSGFPLLKTVNPQWVIFSAGCHNRFGHPALEVQDRYALFAVQERNTASAGMISLHLDGSGEMLRAQAYRERVPRYWRGSQNNPACRY